MAKLVSSKIPATSASRFASLRSPRAPAERPDHRLHAGAAGPCLDGGAGAAGAAGGVRLGVHGDGVGWCGQPAELRGSDGTAPGIMVHLLDELRWFERVCSPGDSSNGTCLCLCFFPKQFTSPNSLLLGFYLRKKRAGHTHWPRP